MSMNVNGAGAVTPLNIQGMDLETALLAVQSQRANLLEDQLKGQIEAVQKKNAQIAQLNTASPRNRQCRFRHLGRRACRH